MNGCMYTKITYIYTHIQALPKHIYLWKSKTCLRATFRSVQRAHAPSYVSATCWMPLSCACNHRWEISMHACYDMGVNGDVHFLVYFEGAWLTSKPTLRACASMCIHVFSCTYAHVYMHSIPCRTMCTPLTPSHTHTCICLRYNVGRCAHPLTPRLLVAAVFSDLESTNGRFFSYRLCTVGLFHKPMHCVYVCACVCALRSGLFR